MSGSEGMPASGLDQAGQGAVGRSGRLRRVLGIGRRMVAAKLGGLGSPRAVLLYASMPALSGVNAVVGLILPALLGPAQFGEYAIAVTLFQYGLILDFGLSQLLDRRLPVLRATTSADMVQHAAQEILWVRYGVAGVAACGGTALLSVLSALGRLSFPVGPGILSLLAGLGFMIALGPMAVWRSTARREAFAGWNAACAIILAAGRPAGMLLGGLTGCFGLLAAGYAALAVRLQAQMPLHAADRPSVRRAAVLLSQGLPLFATSFVWAFYMTANRWVVSFLAPRTELGQFAFGANVVYLLVGTVGALAQLHYPTIVTRAAAGGPFVVSRALVRDMCLLALVVAFPTAVGIVAGPRLIDLFYPAFAGAEAPVRGLLCAVPALVVASWLMPLSLSTATRPWIEGSLIYPAALILLVAGTCGGFRMAGIGGAAWGLLGSAIPLLLLQLGNLRLIGLLTAADAARIFAVSAALSTLLVGLALLG